MSVWEWKFDATIGGYYPAVSGLRARCVILCTNPNGGSWWAHVQIRRPGLHFCNTYSTFEEAKEAAEAVLVRWRLEGKI